MTNPNIAEEVFTCAGQLKAAGLTGWANRIIDAVESGSTGGEIVTAVRPQLQQLLSSNENISESTRQFAQKIFRAINSTGWWGNSYF